MSSVLSLLQVVAWSLAGLAVVSTAINAWRRRDRHRLDIFAFLTAIFANKWITGVADSTVNVVGSTSRLFLAYLLLRLIRHFREVSAPLLNAALVLALALSIASFISPSLSRGWADGTI